MKVSCVLASVICFVGLGSALLSAGDWPQWRGADRSDVSQETGLLKEWPKEGPKQLWLNENAGLGYSGVSIVQGKLFTMGARDGTEFLICLDANSGTELWEAKLGPMLDNGWGDGPRGTPTIDGERVYAMGGNGDLVCAQVSDGKSLWQTTMSDLGGKKPNWGYCESVTVDGPRLLCTPGGGGGSIAALDKLTGDVLWRSTELTNGAQYASILTVVIHDQPQYVQLFQDALAGVSREDGKLLWRADWPGKTAVIPTPIYRDGQVFMTSGYSVGCSLVKIDVDNKPGEVYFNKNMKNHHGGVVLVGDHVYGYSDDIGWTCLDFQTGEIVWKEKSALGKGCVTCADGMLYCMDERDATVVLAEASPNGWKEHGRFELAPLTTKRKPRGHIWTHPVVSNGKLYLRDQDLLFCFDVAAK